MKYVLISDIHGNLPALQAVLADAEKRGADRYLLLGDYIEDLPWPNEVTETIRALPNAVIVRGNKEDYLANLRGGDQSKWTSDQFAPIYWNVREIKPDNLEYLISLPKEITIPLENDEIIKLAHSSPVFYRKPKIKAFYSSYYQTRMEQTPLTHAEYLDFSREALLRHPEAMTELLSYPKGVSTFGHNHLQWYMLVGDTLHVNPGSCGFPSDCDNRAPYTIIQRDETGWKVSEHRVEYDIEEAVSGLVASSLFREAEIWSRIMIRQLRTGRDYISRFLNHAVILANTLEQPINPVSNEIWRKAADTYEMMDIWSEV